MMDLILGSVFDAGLSESVALGDFLLCVGASLLTGLVLAAMMLWRSSYSGGFAVTLATLPAAVCVVIMMVNGNLGAGVAVAGAFSLVRFRSAPGSAREIGAVFAAMGTGLISGMGYLGYSLLFALIIGGATMLWGALGLGEGKCCLRRRLLHVTIPEDLDYSGVFDPVLRDFSSSYRLKSVKTTNLGSLFKLSYELELRDPRDEKRFIDQLRQRNGNLEVCLCDGDTGSAGL